MGKIMNYNGEKTVIDLSDANNISELGLKITSQLDSEGASNKELFLNLGDIDLKQSQLLSIKALVETMQSKLAGINTTSEMTQSAAIGLGLVVGSPSADTRPTFEETFKTEVHEDNDSEDINSFAQLKKQNSIGDFVTDANSLSEVEETEEDKVQTQEFLKEAEDESDDIVDEVAQESELEEETEIEEEAINIETSDLFKNNDGLNIYDDIETNTTNSSDEIQSALDITFGARSEIDSNLKTQINSNTEPIKIQEKFEDYEVTETIEKADEGKYVLLDTEGITPEGIELMKSNTSDLDTLYLTQTLRSGQTVSYEGNIFLIGDAHPGSEIIATGDVTIWGILGGIVHAGSKGNTDAKVRALKLNPIQLRIANLYSRRNDTVNVPFVQKTNEFTPEEARIENEQIVIYKTLRRED